MLQVVPCLVSDLCWKFHANPFIHFPRHVANRHGFPWKHSKRDPVLKGYTWNSPNFPDCFLYHARDILKISWKSLYTFFCNVVQQTNQQRWKHNLRRSAEVTIWKYTPIVTHPVGLYLYFIENPSYSLLHMYQAFISPYIYQNNENAFENDKC